MTAAHLDPRLIGEIAGAALVVILLVRARRGAAARARAAASELTYRRSFDHALLATAILHLPVREADQGPRPRSEGWVVERANHRLSGLVGRDVTGEPWLDLLVGADRERARKTLAVLAAGTLPVWRGELAVAVVGPTGHRRTEIALAALPAATGSPHDGQRVCAQLIDVTDRRLAEARLRDLALRDALTGLANRLLLTDRLAVALARSVRNDGRVALVFCDLDDFKAINDTAGHACGDAVLIEIADRLRRAVRPSDTVARLGGDEFVVVCPDVPDVHVAYDVAGRLLDVLTEPVLVDATPRRCGASIGVALSAPASTPEELLRAADAAMYSAKRAGKQRVHVIDVTEPAAPGTGHGVPARAGHPGAPAGAGRPGTPGVPSPSPVWLP